MTNPCESQADLDACLAQLSQLLLARRASASHWEGCLAGSALSTSTAVLALHLVSRRPPRRESALDDCVNAGTRWLIANQNSDGGWGDTDRSRSNVSTTALVWATLSSVPATSAAGALAAAESWLRRTAGDVTPEALRSAILKRYGKDRTFSVPILTVLALTGKLGTDPGAAWRSIPQLPFELAALPHAWFQHMQLPVVSYALPALIAIGQVRHTFAPSRNPITRMLRHGARSRTLHLLREMQPASGGYLEATPLTSFVVMSLAAMGRTDTRVADEGVRFLIESMRPDGSWPIDTNLATWVTTLSISALAAYESVMGSGVLSPGNRDALRGWLIRQQSTREHPFTHAAPGAWAWTPLSGGVPDADDTSGALVALRLLGEPDEATIAAARSGVQWLLDLQNRDGGMPTFCRGWGFLPFDRSTPEITAHALRAWSAWENLFDQQLRQSIHHAADRAVRYISDAQRADGTWVPLWFGHEMAPDEENPVYGTARVLLGLGAEPWAPQPMIEACRNRAVRWLLRAQNDDGGWSGCGGLPSSIEETGVVLSALAQLPAPVEEQTTGTAIDRGARWLVRKTRDLRLEASPIGLYFARLWYYEELYPLIFSVEGLGRTARGRRQ